MCGCKAMSVGPPAHEKAPGNTPGACPSRDAKALRTGRFGRLGNGLRREEGPSASSLLERHLILHHLIHRSLGPKNFLHGLPGLLDLCSHGSNLVDNLFHELRKSGERLQLQIAGTFSPRRFGDYFLARTTRFSFAAGEACYIHYDDRDAEFPSNAAMVKPGLSARVW